MHWRKLKVWETSHQMVLEIYRTVAEFPSTEKYGLVDQLKRAALSIPANIVEGQSRHTTKEYLHFLYNARGSLEEVRYFVLAARDLNFLSPESYEELEGKSKDISVKLNNLIKSLKTTKAYQGPQDRDPA